MEERASILVDFDKGSASSTAEEKDRKRRCSFPKIWPELESNQRHKDFQSSALPTELSGHKSKKDRERRFFSQGVYRLGEAGAPASRSIISFRIS